MRIVTSGIGLRAGHVLSIFKETMDEAEVVGFYDPQPSHLEMIGTDTPEFDSVEQMHEVYDSFRGFNGLKVSEEGWSLTR